MRSKPVRCCWSNTAKNTKSVTAAMCRWRRSTSTSRPPTTRTKSLCRAEKLKELPHGHSQIWQEGIGESREIDARNEARQTQKRLRQEGDQPQAGDRDRPLGSPQGRRQGAGE